jgi:hypothetical protein
MVIALPAIFFGLALSLGNPPTESLVLESSAGHQAKLSYDAGFLGRDYNRGEPEGFRLLPAYHRLPAPWPEHVYRP